MAKKKGGIAIPDDHAEVLESLQPRVRQSRTKAMLSTPCFHNVVTVEEAPLTFKETLPFSNEIEAEFELEDSP